MALAQSTTQNYVKSTAYKVPTQDGITATDGSGPVTDAKKAINVTYLDGLGRPIQQIAHRQSGTGTDIVTPIVYDAFGRQTHEYLPYASQAPSMDYNPFAVGNVLSFYNTPAYENTPNPYSKKSLEASPLNRVLEQGAPGAAWAVDSLSDADHTIKFDYQTNTSSEVKHFKATAAWNPTSLIYTIALVNGAGTAFYPANTLYRTITRDENWKPATAPFDKLSTTEEFKNKKGQVVLKRTYNMVDGTVTPHDTYYVYDQFGNLTYVVPPLATGNITAKLDGLCYQYRYDHRNRLVEKKLPGKQWEFIVYDKLDRVVATGPALSPFSDFVAPNNTGWLITKYDAFNRPILTAWKQASVTGSTRKTLQELYNGATDTTISEMRTTSPTVNTTMNGVAFNYSNVAEPKVGYHVLTVNYYDDYAFTSNAAWVPAALPTSSLGNAVYYNHTLKPKGLATGSWVRVLETSGSYKSEWSYILYDKKARPILDYKRNHLEGYDYNYTKYDFEGKVLEAKRVHRRQASYQELVVSDYYTYTDQGRLLEHRHSINGGPEELIARNEYDDLGQLKSKRVGGPSTGQGHQKVDYSYNIRGWLKGINDTEDLIQGGTDPLKPGDLFAFRLNYNTVENSADDAVEALYNGNISETFWISNSDNTKRKYGYVYDDLNRLTEAIYQKPDLGNPEDQVTNAYNEEIGYDRNGNILSLSRNGYLDGSTPYTIDQLVYTYTNNQLNRVVDESNSFNGFKDGQNPVDPLKPDYDYDANGNMVIDYNKDITKVTYNHLNLPTRIDFGTSGNHKIEYLYNALGQKLRKAVMAPDLHQITDYLGGFQYVDDALQFFPTVEGYVSVTGSKFKYVYNYTDHLGNIRMSYSRPEVDSPLVVMEESHYYPFGMKHSNYAGEKYGYVKLSGTDGYVVLEAVERSNYQYKYNGKEFQDELSLNLYDYGARNYDPAIGRWMNIDPKAETSRRFSPYTYAFNNPLRFIDPDGMQGQDVIIIGKGRDKAFEQLQSSTSMELQMDDKGKVTTSSSPETYADQQLLSAITDKNVTVQLNAHSELESEDGGGILADSFNGNLTRNDKTLAFQEINVDVAARMDVASEAPGALVKHAVVEAFIGGLIARDRHDIRVSQATQADKKDKNSVYSMAHEAAPYQGAEGKAQYYDPRGNSGRIYVFDKNGKQVNIQTWPKKM